MYPKWNKDADGKTRRIRERIRERTDQRIKERPKEKAGRAIAQQKSPSPEAAPRESTALARQTITAGAAQADPTAVTAAACVPLTAKSTSTDL